MDTSANRGQHGWVVAAALAYLLFVVYGSLVPFAFVDRPMAEVLDAFLPPQWIRLGATDRADWIANALLYMPLAYLALEACFGDDAGERRGGQALVVVGSLALLAVAVEFAQGFFPPRTVSSNDLVAEVAGIIVGTLAWMLTGPRFRAIVGGLRGDRAIARQAFALAVVSGYVVLALFPFDFIISLDELAARWQGPAAGLVFAPAVCTRAWACTGRLGLEAVGGMAFGLAWHWLRANPATRNFGGALRQSLLWGFGIELAQLLEVSGVAQGASVLARTAGIATGLLVAAHTPQAVSRIQTWSGLRPALRVAWLVYAIALLGTTGLLRGDTLSAHEAWARLAEVRLVPFYYHYYVSEQWALVSAAVYLALFAPVGALAAVGRLLAPSPIPRSAPAAVALAIALSLLVESAKLFAGRRPDPTDLLFAAAGSYVAYRLVAYFIVQRRPGPSPVVTARDNRFPLAFGPLTAIGAILLLAATLCLLRYPLPATWLVAALAIYGIALLRWPGAWLVVLPALLPVLDLAPWTGWLFIDEFDLAAMVTVAALSVAPARASPSRLPAQLRVLVVIAGGLALVALVRGLLPLEAITTDALWGLQHHTNALRAARAVLWALLLLALVAHWSGGPERDWSRLARGMTLGLIGAGLVTVWERTTFAGVADFGWSYRATGAFSAASTGGAQLESFVAAALPFACFVVLRGGTRWRIAAVGAVALGAYAVAATVSRTALLGAVAGLIVFAVGAAAGRRLTSSVPRRLAPGAAMASIAVLLLAGGMAMAVSGRMASAGNDFAERSAHWRLVAAMAGSTLTGAVLGEGFGTFPEAYYWNGPASRRPALYSYRVEKATSFVRVAPGTNTFLDQVVTVAPGASYTVRARIRSTVSGASVSLALCTKWIFYSTDCRQVRLRTTAADKWQAEQVALPSPGTGSAGGIFEPTVHFSINGGSVTAPIDITDLALVDPAGHNLLANGNFAAAGTRWLLGADDPWSWNVANAFVETLFEQGWLGLVAFAWLILYALATLAARARRGDLFAAAAAGAVAGFLVPACFDSVIDDPRMRFLALLLLTVPVLVARRRQAPSDGGRGVLTP